MEAWQVEMLKDRIEEMRGQLKVKVFTEEGAIYLIYYHPKECVSFYAKIRPNGEEERLGKAWLHQIQRAVNSPNVRIRVAYRDDEKALKWFREPSRAFEYAMSLPAEEERE